MKVKRMLLTPNEWSRPETPLKTVLAVVMHWTANPNINAEANRNYFEARKAGTNSYGSAHYIIGQDGEIVQAVPENEMAYHCGTDRPDPESGRIYTDEARDRFGSFATPAFSPNMCTIGVEMCPTDWDGNYSDKTIHAAVELVADILRRHNLTADKITTHHNIVGWKDCPRLWTNKPALFEAFKNDVDILLKKN